MSLRMYTFLLYLLLPFTPLKLLWRARKQPEYLEHWRERYGFYSSTPAKPVIWLHCVSVGETRAAEPLIKALLAAYPNHHILLTHITPTGRATSEQLFGNTISRVYLPYDLPFAVSRFLKHFKPAVGVLMETELWFNLIAGCKQQGIPLLLINARLSEKSARGYAKLGNIARDGLQQLQAVAAQTNDDAQRLQLLGAQNISITGNLKFDVAPPDSAHAAARQLRHLLGHDRPVFLAASTREGEEALIIEAVNKANIAHLLTIIVPRHPQRFDEVAALLEKNNLTYVRRSTLSSQPVSAECAFLLGDSMGEMFTYYGACDIAFIGGSLLPLGGQNLIEALSMGKPVLSGPHTFNFEQVNNLAISAGAAIRVADVNALSAEIQRLINSPEARERMSSAATEFSQKSGGAVNKSIEIIRKLLPAKTR